MLVSVYMETLRFSITFLSNMIEEGNTSKINISKYISEHYHRKTDQWLIIIDKEIGRGTEI